MAEHVFRELGRLLQQSISIALPEFGNAFQQRPKAWSSVAVMRREIRAGEEGALIGCQKDGHGPAAAARQGHCGSHVDFVQVGALLPVHFDVHEVTVHHAGDVCIFERLPLHDVAPMAGRVANAEEDWLALILCALQCFISQGYQFTGFPACCSK